MKWYVGLVKVLVQIRSKHEDVFPVIPEQTLVQIIEETLAILQNTINKPYHPLHKECLTTIELIGIIHPKFSSPVHYELLRCIDVFLTKKPVRDEARKAVDIWKRILKAY